MKLPFHSRETLKTTYPMLNHKTLGAALFCVALTIAAPAFSQQVSNQALLNLLIKKGIITQQEADSLQQEASAQTAAPVAAPTKPAMPSSPTAPSIPVPPVAGPGSPSPLAIQIGSAAFTPFGFMDFTSVTRSTNTGGSLATSFGTIPFNNTAAGQLSETRFSAQNSRLGLRVDSDFDDLKVLGYVETDFVGTPSASENVTSNSATMRMRAYFVDLMKGDWEFLAGQDWSLMTPNRKGLSPIPSDLFYTQDVDLSYQSGLIWARQPQVRLVYHASPEWAAGLSLENPDQYVGSAVTLPSNFNAASVDNGSNGTATPNLIPDVIGKIAYDTKIGGFPFHADAAGLFREFKINTLVTGANPVSTNASASGEAVSLNMNVGVAPGLALIENAFYGDGGGRYIANGNAPDFIVLPANAAGVDTLSPVHSRSILGGFEWDATPANKLYAYYSLVNISNDFAPTGAASNVGYGYVGSANTNNKSIEEYTIGDADTIWKKPGYGDLKFLIQTSYLDRMPWYVAPGTPANAHLGMLYMDLRYDLP
jgi:hypothetical protein